MGVVLGGEQCHQDLTSSRVDPMQSEAEQAGNVSLVLHVSCSDMPYTGLATKDAEDSKLQATKSAKDSKLQTTQSVGLAVRGDTMGHHFGWMLKMGLHLSQR